MTLPPDLIDALRAEIIRQSKAEGEAPWVDTFTTGALIRVDGDLNLEELAAAILALLPPPRLRP